MQFNETGALSHLGIQVASTEDVLAIREQWHQRGLITRDEMQTDCCFATQDKTWVLDPDGNEWEVFVVLKDNLPEKARGIDFVLRAGLLRRPNEQGSGDKLRVRHSLRRHNADHYFRLRPQRRSFADGGGLLEPACPS